MPKTSSEFPDFPAYTYVPGFAPHPISDPQGHMRDQPKPSHWTDEQHLQWGQRLFNGGFYWEAHEAWEHVWLSLGRITSEALAIKGLIKLAASAVKCREQNRDGAIRHAIRAAELLKTEVDSSLMDQIHMPTAISVADQFSENPPFDVVPSSRLPIRLTNANL